MGVLRRAFEQASEWLGRAGRSLMVIGLLAVVVFLSLFRAVDSADDAEPGALLLVAQGSPSVPGKSSPWWFDIRMVGAGYQEVERRGRIRDVDASEYGLQDQLTFFQPAWRDGEASYRLFEVGGSVFALGTIGFSRETGGLEDVGSPSKDAPEEPGVEGSPPSAGPAAPIFGATVAAGGGAGVSGVELTDASADAYVAAAWDEEAPVEYLNVLAQVGWTFDPEASPSVSVGSSVGCDVLLMDPLVPLSSMECTNSHSNRFHETHWNHV